MDGTGVTLDTRSSCEIKQNLESVTLSTMKVFIRKYYRNNWGGLLTYTVGGRRFYRLMYQVLSGRQPADCKMYRINPHLCRAQVLASD